MRNTQLRFLQTIALVSAGSVGCGAKTASDESAADQDSAVHPDASPGEATPASGKCVVLDQSIVCTGGFVCELEPNAPAPTPLCVPRDQFQYVTIQCGTIQCAQSTEGDFGGGTSSYCSC